jgi:mannose-6-phosphate isomerase-like protein (cupin superfamily)
MSFRRCNLTQLALAETCAHNGEGLIRASRILTTPDIAGACNFMDYAVVPPGRTIGEHTHSLVDEEYYLILKGTGIMRVNGEEFAVRAGDLVRNPPRGTHALANTGDEDVHIFVFELALQP